MKTLPDLLPTDPSKTIPIISYCCSTGEEPYTLHLLLRTRFGSDYHTRFPIQAFDLNQRALSTARLGEITCDRINDRHLFAEMRGNTSFVQSLGLEFFVKNDVVKLHAKIPDFEKVTFERRDIPVDPLQFSTPVAIFIQNAIYQLKFDDQFALMDKLCALPSDSLLYLGQDTITDQLFSEMLPRTGAFSTATKYTNVLRRR
jgi:chemotaxis methyl-accepting protein methylase